MSEGSDFKLDRLIGSADGGDMKGEDNEGRHVRIARLRYVVPVAEDHSPRHGT